MEQKSDSPVELTSFSELIDSYETFIFDCDGTLWSGSQHFPEAFETLNKLRQKGKKIIFLTNATHKDRKLYREKLLKFGFDTDINTVYNGSFLAASYIKNKHPDIKKVYVVGMKALVDDVKAQEIEVVGGPDHNTKVIESDEDFLAMPVEKDISGVVVGFDFGFNYYKLAFANVCLLQGAKLFATNPDAYDNIGNWNLPRAGCTVAALEKASTKKGLVLGKPNPYALELMMKDHSFDPKKALMIGDNLECDILFGINAGIDTLAVYTGVTTPESLKEELKKPSGAVIPKYVCKNLN